MVFVSPHLVHFRTSFRHRRDDVFKESFFFDSIRQPAPATLQASAKTVMSRPKPF
jgi:hypothetical protein